jgi:ribosome recycling factor
MQIELTSEERDEIVRILTNYLGDTKAEVRRARTSSFRDQLHEEEELLKGLLVKLGGMGETAT